MVSKLASFPCISRGPLTVRARNTDEAQVDREEDGGGGALASGREKGELFSQLYS